MREVGPFWETKLFGGPYWKIGSDHGAHKITQIKKIKKKKEKRKREQWEQAGGVVPNSSWEP